MTRRSSHTHKMVNHVHVTLQMQGVSSCHETLCALFRYHQETSLSQPPYPSREGMPPGLKPPPTTHALALLRALTPNTMLLTLLAPPPPPLGHCHTLPCNPYQAGLQASSWLRTGPITPHLSPQPEGPHSPLCRESGPGPVPAKEQNDPISILWAPL